MQAPPPSPQYPAMQKQSLTEVEPDELLLPLSMHCTHFVASFQYPTGHPVAVSMQLFVVVSHHVPVLQSVETSGHFAAASSPLAVQQHNRTAQNTAPLHVDDTPLPWQPEDPDSVLPDPGWKSGATVVAPDGELQ